MKNEKRIYIKKSPKWTIKKVSKHSLTIYKSIIILMALFTLWAYINRQVNKGKLISPLVNITVPQVQASEPVVISCEDPRGYLECQMYNGNLTAEEYRIMEAIAEAESHFNPNASQVNIHKDGSTSIDRGIFQLNHRYQKAISNEDAFNFKKNIDYAIKLMKRSGYGQWSAFNNGSYIKHLNTK